MAKILFSFLQPLINKNPEALFCYYDSLSQELNSLGNDVLLLNNMNIDFMFENDRQKQIGQYKNKTKNFNPDIIFAFNNSIFEEIISVTNCPIVLFEADLSKLFVYNDLIKKYNDRYYIVTFFPKYISVYKDLGFREDRIIHLHPATTIKAEKNEKENNISFIGSSFAKPSVFLSEVLIEKYSENLYNLYKELWNEHNYNYDELFKKHIKDLEINSLEQYPLLDSRTYILQSLLDLGLKIYGVNWDKLPSIFLPLISAFDKTPKYTLKHNQDVYNSSVINISISHPQCEGYAFPWRIYDIMASDGVLVSSYSKALEEYTKGYIDVPMYKSPYDARDLCKKLLKEENLRKDIICSSNEFIKKQGRWLDNFKKLQEYTNVNFINNKDELGKKEIVSCNYEFVKNKKAQIKSILYGMIYSIMHYPIIKRENLKNFREKIYKLMIKYNKELQRYIIEKSLR